MEAQKRKKDYFRIPGCDFKIDEERKEKVKRWLERLAEFKHEVRTFHERKRRGDRHIKNSNGEENKICVAADNVYRFKTGSVIQHPVLPQEPPQEEPWV